MLPIGYYAKLHSQEKGYVLCHKAQTGLITFLECLNDNTWTHEEKNALIFPDYNCVNNLAYRKWQYYKVARYEVVPCGLTLYPCHIKYHEKLYLKDIQLIRIGLSLGEKDLRLVSHWTSCFEEAKLLNGPEEAAATLMELLKLN